MYPSIKNERVARQIINIFAENNCTVEEANSILSYVRNTISAISTVQEVKEKLFEDANPG